MTAHFFNKSFIYLLTIQDTLLSIEACTAQYFVFDQYAKMIFLGIIPNTHATKVSTARKSHFKAL